MKHSISSRVAASWFFLFVFFSGLSLSSLIVPLASQTVNAQDASSESKETVKRYEGLRALLQGYEQDDSEPNCARLENNKALPLDNKISKSDYENPNFSILIEGTSRAYMPVPATLFGESNNEISCETALGYYWKYKYTGTNEEKHMKFIRDYYDVSKLDNITLKENSETKLWSDVHAWMLTLISGRTSEFIHWRNRIISQAFNSCFQWNNGNVDIKNASDSVKYDPDSWTTENGGNKSVGYMAESELEKRYDDGIVNCDTVKDYVLGNKANHFLVSFGTSALANQLLRDSQISNIMGMFLSNLTGYQDCVSQHGTAALKSATGSLPLERVSEWLINEQRGELRANQEARNSTIYIANNKATAMYNCLIEKYPNIKTELARTSDEIDTSREPETPPGSDSTVDEDNCDMQFQSPLSWIVCPIMDLLQAAINTYYSAVHSVLNFDIEQYNKDGNVRKMWEVIRNLANILFVIAFLAIILSQTLIGKL